MTTEDADERNESDWIPSETWRDVVASVPIVAVDLVALSDGGVVLGQRQNEPARGSWFVPGGRVQKGESLTDAVHRIAAEEIGATVSIRRQLGVYEHRYDVADVDVEDGKHYVPIGYVVEVTGASGTDADGRHGDGGRSRNGPPGPFATDDQHSELRVVEPPYDDVEVHPYTRDYLDDLHATGDPFE
jgi:colanic acid biosynthesis protein WcaH